MILTTPIQPPLRPPHFSGPPALRWPVLPPAAPSETTLVHPILLQCPLKPSKPNPPSNSPPALSPLPTEACLFLTKAKLHITNLNLTKVSSPKQHPQQMQTGDFPPDFATTKNELYIHIKVLWGLLKRELVPPAPNLQRLWGFYKIFSNSNQIAQAANQASLP
ncbi:hypothetical protein VP01_4476g2 [Puccinia sorghi]|uniref:Uncharacterized protein n=1 Tax=Puccinia sorghi TaxID=27349 RepID=A0A0L6UPB3_9BASI|nr:hypothetical protein VP01_4476g2 [Puccinia sorghi]